MTLKQPLRRLLSLLLLTAATLSAIPLSAEEFTIGSLTYTSEDNSTASVSKCDRNVSGELIIPASVEYDGRTYSVTNIGAQVFYRCSSLTSVTIPNSVTSIGDATFSYCSGLTSVSIPNSVTSIGQQAFYWCSKLISVEIPNSVTSIGQQAFFWCSSLTSVEIPNSVTGIGDAAFYCCISLTSVTIPNSVTSIGEGAFQGCSALTSMELPNSVTSIGGLAFQDCSGLTSVSIPNSVTSIGWGAFSWCSSLTDIQVEPGNPNYCSVDGVLFNSDKSEIVAFPSGKAGEYQIPGSVIEIGNGIFTNCISLTSVTIPNSVTSTSEGAFSGCSSLTDIQVEPGNPNYCSVDGVLFNSDESKIVAFPPGKAGEYQIPGSVIEIGNGIFTNCINLTSVTIPNSVTSIGDAAFFGCRGLTSVTIPNSVTSIGESAFFGCRGLTSVTIPNSVTSIGNDVFAWCTSLTSITIPNSVTSIGEGAFYSCTGLESITIPNSVTSIGYGAFYNCGSLTSVTIPSSVTYIDYYTFEGCDNLSIYLFGRSADQLPVESVYTFYDNGYSYDNAVYLIGEITTTQTTAEFDVQKVEAIESFEFEYTDATGAIVKETADQSGLVSLGNLNPGSTTTLKITVHMTNGEAYDYNSEVTTKDADDQSAIEVVEIEGAAGFDIYTTSGERVHRNATDLSGLRPGIYIANGRKFIVR